MTKIQSASGGQTFVIWCLEFGILHTDTANIPLNSKSAITASWSRTVQPHESSTVIATQGAHQSCKALTGISGAVGFGHDHRETDRVDPYPARTVLARLIDLSDRINDRLNGVAAKLVTEYV